MSSTKQKFDIKLCANCRYYKKTLFFSPLCTNLKIATIDIISGKYVYMKCWDARYTSALNLGCGTKGEYYEGAENGQ